MSASPVSTRLLSPHIGCEIEFDLATEPSAAQLAAMKALFSRHAMLVFRNQQLGMERQADVCDWFGPVLRTRDGLSYISNVRADGVLGDNDLGFHSDLAYAPYPYDSLSLHAIDVVNDATTTRYINAAEAYRRLPEPLRKRLQGLRVLHVSAGRSMSGRPANVDYEADYPQHVRPLVINHPHTGVPVLFVMESQTVKVLDMPADASEALLQELFGYLYADKELAYEHSWRLGDIVIWDNYALQHARSNIKGRGNRTLQRTAAGPQGLFVQYPQLDGLYTNK